MTNVQLIQDISDLLAQNLLQTCHIGIFWQGEAVDFSVQLGILHRGKCESTVGRPMILNHPKQLRQVLVVVTHASTRVEVGNRKEEASGY